MHAFTLAAVFLPVALQVTCSALREEARANAIFASGSCEWTRDAR